VRAGGAREGRLRGGEHAGGEEQVEADEGGGGGDAVDRGEPLALAHGEGDRPEKVLRAERAVEDLEGEEDGQGARLEPPAKTAAGHRPPEERGHGQERALRERDERRPLLGVGAGDAPRPHRLYGAHGPDPAEVGHTTVREQLARERAEVGHREGDEEEGDGSDGEGGVAEARGRATYGEQRERQDEDGERLQ